MRLVRAELHRLVARDFVRLMVVLLVAAFAVTVGTTLAGSHPPDRSEILTAQRTADETFATMQRSYLMCLEAQRPNAPSSGRVPARMDCDRLRPDGPDLAAHLPGVFVFERTMARLSYFLIAFLMLFGFLVGASAIGAELTSGGMTNLLLWRPQRMTVLAAKLGTVLGATLVVSVVAAAGYVGAFRLVAEVAGLPGRLGGDFWGGLLLLIGRGLLLVLLTTAIGFAIATLGRHTAAAAGVATAYAVVWEAGARIVMDDIDLWMLSTYMAAWVRGRLDLWDVGECAEILCVTPYTLTWSRSLLVLLAVAGGCLGAAFTTFRRRDLA